MATGLIVAADLSDDETLVDSADLRHLLLKQIADQHCLLELRVDGLPDAFQSMIIELVPDRGYLVIDALVPREGDDHAAELPAVSIRTRLNGLDVRFDSRITQRAVAGGEPFYKVPYPLTIDYPQRRSEHRVPVPVGRAAHVVLDTGGGRTIAGDVRDLSPSGFSARVTRGDVSVLGDTRGRRIKGELVLPGGDTVRAELETCHVLPARGRAAARLGLRFVALAPRDERRIERCVAELGREQTRLR